MMRRMEALYRLLERDAEAIAALRWAIFTLEQSLK